MQWRKIVGQNALNGYAPQAEAGFVAGYNGVGVVMGAHNAVCWDTVASDGRTFVAPAADNWRLAAGLLAADVNTADYTVFIQVYGIGEAYVSGAAAHAPGCALVMGDGYAYLEYGTIGQDIGQVAGGYTALSTDTTSTPGDCITGKVFIRLL